MSGFDPTQPSAGDYINSFPAKAQANWSAVQSAIGAEHVPLDTGTDGTQCVHKIPVLTASPTGSEGRLAIISDILNWYSNGSWRNGSPIPSGTKMLFAQASAPTGWTQDTTIDDKMLRVVSGSGGGTGGSWTASGVSVAGHALTTDEIPSHTHETYNTVGSASSIGISAGFSGGDALATISSGATGGGSAHTHSITLDTTWRPAYLDIIIADKD